MEGLPPWLLLVKGRRMGVIVELGALGFSRSNKSPLTLGGGGGREGISCVLPPPSPPRPAPPRGHKALSLGLWIRAGLCGKFRLALQCLPALLRAAVMLC